jgi:chromosome segregation ATPase
MHALLRRTLEARSRHDVASAVDRLAAEVTRARAECAAAVAARNAAQSEARRLTWRLEEAQAALQAATARVARLEEHTCHSDGFTHVPLEVARLAPPSG